MLHKLHHGHHKRLGLLIIRVVAGIIFLVHGVAKLKGIDATAAMFDMVLPVGTGLASVLAWAVAIIETLGGIAFILGFFTRFFGWLLGLILLVAIIFVKSKMPFAAGEIDLMLLAAVVGVAVAGPGRWSLGHHMCRTCTVCDHCAECKDGCTGHEHAK